MEGAPREVYDLTSQTKMKRRIWERVRQKMCLHRAMINKNKEQDVGGNIIRNKEGAVCREAMEKNCKEKQSAIKAMKVCGQAALESGVGIGALVSLKVDCCTHCHAQGLLEILSEWSEETRFQPMHVLVGPVHAP